MPGPRYSKRHVQRLRRAEARALRERSSVEDAAPSGNDQFEAPTNEEQAAPSGNANDQFQPPTQEEETASSAHANDQFEPPTHEEQTAPVDNSKIQIKPAVHTDHTASSSSANEQSTPKPQTAPSGNATDKFKPPKNKKQRGKIKPPIHKSFLDSLSMSDPDAIMNQEAQMYKIYFSSKKDVLLRRLFLQFNKELFNNAIYDEIRIDWTPSIAAGATYLQWLTNGCRGARIELSYVIVDRPDRLRDTLVHEMVHACAWIRDGCTEQHGRVFEEYAALVKKTYPTLPPVKEGHEWNVWMYHYHCELCLAEYYLKKQMTKARYRCKVCKRRGHVDISEERQIVPGLNLEFNVNGHNERENRFNRFVRRHYEKFNMAQNLSHGQVMENLRVYYEECLQDPLCDV